MMILDLVNCSLMFACSFQKYIQIDMGKADKIVPDKIIGLKPPLTKASISEKDSIIYALGIGFSRDPLRKQDFKYTNELDENFTPFPTIGVVLAKGDLFSPLLLSQHVPHFSAFAILHAQHKLTLVKQKIQVDREYQNEKQLIDCSDKGKNAFILFRESSYIYNQKNQRQLAFQNETLLFIKGLGGFNYEGKGLIKPLIQIPERKPDYNLIGKTFPDQAFLYRLSFDVNPLHIDPNIAQSQKYQRPILHGLATYGTVARVVVQEILFNDPTLLKSYQTRFVGHVYPGETLNIRVWKEGNLLIYEAEVEERKKKALIGYMQIREKPKL